MSEADCTLSTIGIPLRGEVPVELGKFVKQQPGVAVCA